LRAEIPEGSVLIQADKDSYAETLMSVMAAARQARVPVSIAAVN
jgi:biopolymer transport protein ExbD